MAHIVQEDQFSDEEVFIGKLSLREIKKHILWNNPQNLRFIGADSKTKQDSDIKIIETHSAPNLNSKNINTASSNIKPQSSISLSPNEQEVYTDWEVKPVDDSFLKVEQMVTNLCLSPEKKVSKDEFNSTLDIIDYILKNGAPCSSEKNTIDKKETEKKVAHENPNIKLKTPGTLGYHSHTPLKHSDKIKADSNLLPSSPAYFTPAKSELKQQRTEKFSTPVNLKSKTPLFKTPANPLSIKKPTSSLKKTPMKSNGYQHIASPIASYIKNCPVAPLVKEVRPTKPLPGSSSIPKFVKKSVDKNPGNKENVNLPSVAYKSAKKTQVIRVPDEEKLPKSLLVKKITSSLPKPLIMKHNHREISSAKRTHSLQQEDSFADLSLRQADMSICTQKSAFNKLNKA